CRALRDRTPQFARQKEGAHPQSNRGWRSPQAGLKVRAEVPMVRVVAGALGGMLLGGALGGLLGAALGLALPPSELGQSLTLWISVVLAGAAGGTLGFIVGGALAARSLPQESLPNRQVGPVATDHPGTAKDQR